jgi:hypothetical protein
MLGYHIKRGAYTGGPTWQLWQDRGVRCDIVFEATDELLRDMQRREHIFARELAFLYLVRRAGGPPL